MKCLERSGDLSSLVLLIRRVDLSTDLEDQDQDVESASDQGHPGGGAPSRGTVKMASCP